MPAYKSSNHFGRSRYLRRCVRERHPWQLEHDSRNLQRSPSFHAHGERNRHGSGHPLAAFIPTVLATDPAAKVIYGGQAEPVGDSARRALDACRCASGVDVFAYHTYPGYNLRRTDGASRHGRSTSHDRVQQRSTSIFCYGLRLGFFLMGR
jgi:hypothetical protein